MGAILEAMLKRKQLDELSDRNLAQIPVALQAFTQARERAIGLDLERRKTTAQIDALTSEAAKHRGEASLYQGIMGTSPAGSAGPTTLDTVTRSKLRRGLQSKLTGTPYEELQTPEERTAAIGRKVEEKQAEKLAEGIPTSEAGKMALAKDSVRDLDDVIATLFPDGTAKSFQRGVAFQSNLPGVSVPLAGRVTPQMVPTKKGQNVFRKMGTAYAGRQLIQTGVAARPVESAKLVEQFGPNVFSNPDATLTGLKELRDFYQSYMDTVKTRGMTKGSGVDYKSKYGLD